ncbi:50S ribosomal protein L29 [Phormidium sp. CCY1219]|uniref:50S ribosomal protein L29 n=1 Tax=Phormidium sp. CCY1219 TaxID=2886104 RepID=UPI002D1F947A|nr:50S ribosomal protein L29 [Phormidium sp. CCY1219]MEB3826647.1 50S ribosomal protein L29 [Phormidium sp. CCY1219]
MAFPKVSEVRNLSDEQIAEEIVTLKRELFELRLQKATRRLEKTHLFKHKKHKLAQLLTVEGERKRAQAAKAAAEAQTPSESGETAVSASATSTETESADL